MGIVACDFIIGSTPSGFELAKHVQIIAETTRTEMMTSYNADLKSIHANLLHVLRQELAQEIVKMRSKEVKGKK